MIESQGGIAVRFPTIEIAPPGDPQALQAAVAALEQFNLAVFVSPNAVTYAFAAIGARGFFLRESEGGEAEKKEGGAQHQASRVSRRLRARATSGRPWANVRVAKS